MAIISVGKTVRITATFRGWIPATPSSTIDQDPTSVSLAVLDDSNNILSTPAPIRDDIGIYHYDWTPSAPGTFIIQFTATYSNGLPEQINTEFTVIPVSGSFSIPLSANSLVQDQYIQFMINPQPMLLDPEEFLITWPDASLFQISELVYQYSQEVFNILKDWPQDTLATLMTDNIVTQTALDFVEAAVNCALSRTYDITQGADISQITLGDLTIATTRSLKDNPSRATATTWCELAGVIRNELYQLSKRSGMKAMLKGSKYCNPIPMRRIQHIEWKDWDSPLGYP